MQNNRLLIALAVIAVIFTFNQASSSNEADLESAMTGLESSLSMDSSAEEESDLSVSVSTPEKLDQSVEGGTVEGQANAKGDIQTSAPSSETLNQSSSSTVVSESISGFDYAQPSPSLDNTAGTTLEY